MSPKTAPSGSVDYFAAAIMGSSSEIYMGSSAKVLSDTSPAAASIVLLSVETPSAREI